MNSSRTEPPLPKSKGDILDLDKEDITALGQQPTDYACTFPEKQAEFAPFQRTLTTTDMKQGIHPEYREVVFQDTSTDFAILTRSTIQTKDSIKWEDGNEYPLVKLEVSSASHPFYTGKQHVLQSARQVDKFRERYGKK